MELTFEKVLAPNRMLLATFIEAESGERGPGREYPGIVPYPFEEIAEMAEEAGLVARRIRLTHPLQKWIIVVFVFGHGACEWPFRENKVAVSS